MARRWAFVLSGLGAFALSSVDVSAQPNLRPILVQNEGEAGIRLAGLFDNGNHFTAVIEIRNPTNQPMGVALYSRTAFSGEAYLRDGSGGECQAVANGEPWGTIRPVTDGWVKDASRYAVTSPNTMSRQTIFFWKQRCISRISNGSGVSLDGDFVIVFAGRIRHQNLSWSGLDILSAR
jgi:hypothetical protein